MELTRELTIREIKSRYKQSILGYAWVILNPFFQMLVMAFVFSKILRITNLTVPYALFLYVGLLPWNLFTASISSSMNSLVENRSLIMKIYFPREIFVISAIFAKIVDFLLASIILILFFFFFNQQITLNILWIIPIFFIQQLFTYGLSLILAALNLFYRDIQYLFGLILLIWMYLTPVIYPIEMFPEQYRWIFKLNPMAVFINAYRQVMLGGGIPNFTSLGLALLLSIVMVVGGYKVFKRLEGIFADVV
ncbi:MAG: ABC transporter permease [Patescibacteria group bacterium]